MPEDIRRSLTMNGANVSMKKIESGNTLGKNGIQFKDSENDAV